MPYGSMDEVPDSLKGIDPPITLAQANLIAEWADAMEAAEDGPEEPWAAAIAQFKDLYEVNEAGDGWVEKDDADDEAEADVESESVGEVGEALRETVRGIVRDAVREALALPDMGLNEWEREVRNAFSAQFATDEERWRFWVEEIYVDHAQLGNALIVEDGDAGGYYHVPWSEGDEGIEFAPSDQWQPVRRKRSYEFVSAGAAGDGEDETTEESEGVAESAGPQIVLKESEPMTTPLRETMRIVEVEAASEGENRRGPIRVNIVPIEPGPGNAHDRHYYPREVVEQAGSLFRDVKMHLCDHDDSRRSVQTEASVIEEVVGATETGAPIAKMLVYDPNTAERVRNLRDADRLNLLEFSIYGEGLSQPGEVDGEEFNVVQEITHIDYVDWVTRAGAGGRALSIAERAERAGRERGGATEEDDMGKLDESKVSEILGNTRLPEAARHRLAEGEYDSEEALTEAIQAEADYLSQATGAGDVFGLGEGDPEPEAEIDEAAVREAYQQELDNVDAALGIRRRVPA